MLVILWMPFASIAPMTWAPTTTKMLRTTTATVPRTGSGAFCRH